MGFNYEFDIGWGVAPSTEYKIISINHKHNNKERKDGRYPERIGRICKRPIYEIGDPMIVEYISNADGTDYSGYFLRTSCVVDYKEYQDYLIIETENSIYEFEKILNYF